MSDWLTVFSIVVAWILGANAVLMAQNLRSRRKRPEPHRRGSEPQGAREITLVEQAWKEGYEARKLQMKVMKEWTSPPSSRATETTEATPPGKRGS